MNWWKRELVAATVVGAWCAAVLCYHWVSVVTGCLGTVLVTLTLRWFVTRLRRCTQCGGLTLRSCELSDAAVCDGGDGG